MFTIGICDDNAGIRTELRNICQNKMRMEKMEFQIVEFAYGDELLSTVNKGSTITIDLLFLDIEMPGEDGLGVRDRLLKGENIRRFIFVSSHSERIMDAFGLKTIGFIKKPIDDSVICKKIDVVLKEYREKRYITFQDSRSASSCFLVEDIIYLEAERNYTKIYFIDRKTNQESYELLSLRLGEIEKTLETDNLIRIHKSYIVNLDHCSEVNDKVCLRGQKLQLPIGRKYKQQVFDFYMSYVLKKARERY